MTAEQHGAAPAEPGRRRRPLTLSLRARVLASMTLVAIVLLAAGIVVVRTTSTHLIDQIDRQLERASGPVAGGPRPPGFGSDVDGTSTDSTNTDASFTTFYVGIVTDGRVESRVFPTVSGTDAPEPDLTAADAERAASTGALLTVPAVDGGSDFRVAARTDQRTGAVMVVGQQLTDVDAATQRLITVMAVTGLVLLGVLALITWWVLRLGVRPIKRMTSAATDIAGGDLSHRIPPAPVGTEAAELGDALNTMLANIQAAFDERAASQDRLRQFVADASHELRTPVATIRGYAELQRTGGLEVRADLDTAMRRVEQEAIRMGNLVADLLELARLDQGRAPRLERVELAALATDCGSDFATVHRGHPLTLEVTEVATVGDPDLLHQVVANLLTNAAVHTPPGTAVHLHVRMDGRSAAVSVADDGPGMSAEDAASAFERFHRADPSRTRSSGGAGLGLSIVRAVVEAHGGTVSLRSAPGQGTEVSVRLPLSSASDPVTGRDPELTGPVVRT